MALVFGLALFLVIWVLIKDKDRAGLLASFIIILFFAYGHVYGLSEGIALSGQNIGRHRFLLLAWGIVFVIGTLLVLKFVDAPRRFTNPLNIIAITALILPMFNITSFYLDRMDDSPVVENLKNSNGNQEADHLKTEFLPDVYYIILDAYGRQDVLEALYQYDNSDFRNRLSDHGFFVAEKSISNYGQTILSLSSSLNLNYLEEFNDLSDSDSVSRANLISALQDSLTRRMLESLGYTTIAFDSGYYGTKIVDADYFLAPAEGGSTSQRNILASFSLTGSLNPFEVMILQSSFFRVGSELAVNCLTSLSVEKESTGSGSGPEGRKISSWNDELCQVFAPLSSILQNPFTDHRNRILFTFDELQSLPETGTPRFVFAHIVAPHHPYVFGSNGNVTKNPGASELFQNYEGTRQSYISGYVDQIKYIEKRTLEVVDEILSNSETPPIIIIQADHGPDANMVGNDISSVPYFVERFSILNVYYLPPTCSDELLYDSISPINSFRIVFNACFASEYEQLVDRAYYSTYDRPFDMTDVSAQLWK